MDETSFEKRVSEFSETMKCTRSEACSVCLHAALRRHSFASRVYLDGSNADKLHATSSTERKSVPYFVQMAGVNFGKLKDHCYHKKLSFSVCEFCCTHLQMLLYCHKLIPKSLL